MRKVTALIVVVAALAAVPSAFACYGTEYNGWSHIREGWANLSPTSSTVSATINVTGLSFGGPTSTDDTFSAFVVKYGNGFWMEAGLRYADSGLYGGGFLREWMQLYIGGQFYDFYGPAVNFNQGYNVSILTVGANQQVYFNGTPTFPPVQLSGFNRYDILSEEDTQDGNYSCMYQTTSFYSTSFGRGQAGLVNEAQGAYGVSSGTNNFNTYTIYR